MITRIVGIGQPVAGDDGVGIAVLDELRRRRVPPGAELVPLVDPTELVALLEGPARIIVIDAVRATPAGAVIELDPEELAVTAAHPHGLGVAQAIALARVLSPNVAPPRVRIVGVTIGPPERGRCGLSPGVAAAVPVAAARVLVVLGT